MTTTKKVSIKLNPTKTEGVYEREAWFGWGPFNATINPDSGLTVQFLDQEIQTVAQRENEFGPYWMVKISDGLGFIREINHAKYGHYLQLKLADDVTIPESVKEKLGDSSGPRVVERKTGAKSGFKPKPTTKKWS